MLKWILWSIIKVLGSIPFRLRSSIGAGLGACVALFPSRDLRFAEMQIRCFLHSDQASKIAKKVYSNFGRTFFECMNIKPLISNPENFIDFPGWPEADLLLKQKRGIIALTAHLGNWDVMGAYFANKQVPLLAIAKQTRNPDFQYILEKLRDSFGFKTLWRANKKAISEILEALSSGYVVAALIDQDTRVSNLAIPFFGTKASTPSTIIEIGKRAGAIFTTAFVVRNASNRFEIIVEEIPSELSTEEILGIYNQRLEEIIRKYPSQWAWVHKRWRTLPSGERLGGQEYLKFLIDKEKAISKEHNALQTN